jgi:hypothetical protein
MINKFPLWLFVFLTVFLVLLTFFLSIRAFDYYQNVKIQEIRISHDKKFYLKYLQSGLDYNAIFLVEDYSNFDLYDESGLLLTNDFVYYKLSNDTLFLKHYGELKHLSKIDTTMKIVLLEEIVLSWEAEHKKLERSGFKRFP